ncbi:MAG: guanylate kinase [Lachnospiraceae bacterium]|nr:guanylate kinase [Lachnospiraceae bacterium]MCI7595749.1 guanylate kinase [Lachnospiraceae bacterium]MDD7049638.1 guanylate kinase [Lachnospiraceae bacterium]MDY3223685.1 guanylate kinase [Lachnospiraceae bacterium]MDY4097125.1 guanylate kinase [Lachnospiraceae bacterium]
MKGEGLLIVISGFSGAGKGTLMKRLIEDYQNYALSISMTTRPPRQGEVEGREYFFATREQFEEKIAQDGFIEYASYCGNYYGTPRAYVESQLAAGKDVILEIEIQGAMKIKEKYPDALLLFVMPPSAKALYSRLTGRGTETEEVIQKRLSRAAEESVGIEGYDYVMINDDLEQCVRQLHQLLQDSHLAPVEEYKPVHHIEFIEEIRKQLQQLVKGEK